MGPYAFGHPSMFFHIYFRLLCGFSHYFSFVKNNVTRVLYISEAAMCECAKTAASSTLCPAMTGCAPSATKTSKWSVCSDQWCHHSWPLGKCGAICRVWRYGNNDSCRGRHHAGSGAGEYRPVYLVTKYGPAIAIEWSAININTRTNVFLRIFHLRFMYEDMRYGAMHKLIYYELHA